MRITSLILSIIALCSTAHAIDSSIVPAIGCYKTNGSDACADDVYIHCGDISDSADTIRRRANKAYGPVIANFCGDLLWMSDQAIADGTEIERLKQRLAQYKAKLLRQKK